MPGKKKKTTTIVEEIPPGESPLLEDNGETSELDLDLHSADSAEIVDQLLKENGISGVLYRFYDNDGGYSYSSSDIDYDRARRETKGGKNCKMAVFINGKIIRMVPFPLSPVDPATLPPAQSPQSSDITFLKEMVLKLVESRPGSGVSGPSLAELTTALANLDTLRGKQESTMDLFMKGMEFAQSAGGQTDWKTDALRTVRDIAPQVMSAINGLRGGNGNPSPVPIENGGGEMPPDAIIKSGIAYLKKKAIAGVDPDLIIEWVANNGEEYEALLRVVLNSEFADFVKFDPEIGTEPFVSWFKPLFDGLRSAFKQPDTMDDDSRGNVGDTSNAGSNGKPREGGSAKSKS